MRSPFHPRFRRACLAVLLLSAAPAALAQYPQGATVEHLPGPDDPAELLAQALRVLATEPTNLQALLTAGHNALALGDVNAAVGLYGRASAVAPRDGRVKAGLGAAMVQLQRPDEALRLFADARRLGIAPAQFAADEGLAYDLAGQQARAQQDYQVALGANPADAVARRRLALSQGISGDKTAALKTLDPLIRASDRAAWRDQTFILAMTGDAPGANAITRVMLPQQSEMLQPFLARLAALSPVDKARAVTFGEIPEGGRIGAPPQMAAAPAYRPAPPYRATQPTRAAAAVSAPSMPTRVAQAAPASDLAPRPAMQTAPVRVASAEPMRAAAGPTVGTPVLHETARSEAAQAQEARAPSPVPMRVADAGPAPNGATVGTPVVHETARSAAAAEETRSVAPPVALPVAATPVSTAGTPMLRETASAAAAPSPNAPTAQEPLIPVRRADAAPATIGAAVPQESARTEPAPAAPVRLAAIEPSHPATVTEGTPVVHETAPAKVTSPRHSARAELAAADRHADAAEDSPSSRRPGKAEEDDASAPRHGKGANHEETAKSRKDKSEEVADTHETRRHGKAADEGDDSSPSAKRHGKAEEVADARATHRHGKAADESDDDGTATKRHGKSSDDSAATRHGRAKQDVADAEPAPRHKGKAARDEDESDAPKSRHAEAKSTKGHHAKAEDDEAPASRIYVQVAGGANKDDLDRAWDKVRHKAPELTKGKKPLTAPLNHTNRLVVGPFKSEDEAQAYVNKMAGKGVSSFIYKSTKREKIEKVDTAS